VSYFFFPSRVSGRERKGRGERQKEMEGTDDDSVETDPREWSEDKVATLMTVYY
jgi:hypothetical protein